MKEYSDKKIVIWGLGVNGGGLASALFFLRQGVPVTILDDKPISDLESSLSQLESYISLYRFHRTNEKDLKEADLVIKNPGVLKSHPLLKVCYQVETDISLFLERNRNPILAVTGSKGKTSLVTLLTHILKKADRESKLGGNVTYSPLNFLDNLNGKSPVVLELSSWQLSDLPKNLLKPKVALLTNIYYDHQNTYDNFDDYIRDKIRLVENQGKGDIFFCEAEAYHSHFIRLWEKSFRSRLILFPSLFSFRKKDHGQCPSIFIRESTVFYRMEGGIEKELFFLPEEDLQLVNYTKMLAGAMAIFYGLERILIEKALKERIFLPYRLEWIAEKRGVDYYNDSAATLPEATMASIQSLIEKYSSLVLIIGGTDKNLDFSCFNDLFQESIQWILFSGSATIKLQRILEERSIGYSLWNTLEDCLEEAFCLAKEGEAVLFSPASASFEKFKNEFDRGNRFKALVKSL